MCVCGWVGVYSIYLFMCEATLTALIHLLNREALDAENDDEMPADDDTEEDKRAEIEDDDMFSAKGTPPSLRYTHTQVYLI